LFSGAELDSKLKTRNGSLRHGRRRFEPPGPGGLLVWPPVVTLLLTGRVMLTGESESFPPSDRPPVGTPTFPTAPQPLSLEPEKTRGDREDRETLCPRPHTKKPRELSLSGLSAISNVTLSTWKQYGSPNRARTWTLPVNSRPPDHAHQNPVTGTEPSSDSPQSRPSCSNDSACPPASRQGDNLSPPPWEHFLLRGDAGRPSTDSEQPPMGLAELGGHLQVIPGWLVCGYQSEVPAQTVVRKR
jgi:hypothetical protein